MKERMYEICINIDNYVKKEGNLREELEKLLP